MAYYGAANMPYDVQREYQWQLIAEHRPGYTKAEIESLNQREVKVIFAFINVREKLKKKNSKSKR